MRDPTHLAGPEEPPLVLAPSLRRSDPDPLRRSLEPSFQLLMHALPPGPPVGPPITHGWHGHMDAIGLDDSA